MARTLALQRLADLQSAIDADAERLPNDLYLQVCAHAKAAYDAIQAVHPNATGGTRARSPRPVPRRTAAPPQPLIDWATFLRVATLTVDYGYLTGAAVARNTVGLQGWQRDLVVATYAAYVFPTSFNDAGIHIENLKDDLVRAYRALTHPDKCAVMPALLNFSLGAHAGLARDLNEGVRGRTAAAPAAAPDAVNNNNNEAAAPEPASAPPSPTANLVTESLLGAALTGFANAIGSRVAPTDMALIRGLLAGIRGRRRNAESDPEDEPPAARRRLA